MSRLIPAATLVLLLVMAAVGAAQSRRAAAAERAAGGPAFSDYQLIFQRNIFDARRRAPSARRSDAPPAEPVYRSIQLVGVLVGDEESTAFFTGDDRTHTGPRRQGERIAEATIEAVTTTGITVTLNGRRQEWAVGSPMRRIGDGEWYLPAPPPAGASDSVLNDPAAEAALLERLRQRRAQETRRD
jgi:hypothetical protein